MLNARCATLSLICFCRFNTKLDAWSSSLAVEPSDEKARRSTRRPSNVALLNAYNGGGHSGSKIYNHHAAFVDATRTKSSLYNPLTPMDDVQLMSRCLQASEDIEGPARGCGFNPGEFDSSIGDNKYCLAFLCLHDEEAKESLWEIWLGRRAHHSPGDIPIYEIQEYLGEEMGFYFVRLRPHPNP